MSAIRTSNAEVPQPEASQAFAQRTEIHVGLSDEALTELAVRAVFPRRPVATVQAAPEGVVR